MSAIRNHLVLLLALGISMGGNLRIVWQVLAPPQYLSVILTLSYSPVHSWRESLGSWREVGILSGVTWPDVSGMDARDCHPLRGSVLWNNGGSHTCQCYRCLCF